MHTFTAERRAARPVGAARIVVGLVVLAVLTWAYGRRIAVGDDNPFDYFGYFTNQTSLLASLAMVVAGAYLLAGRAAPRWVGEVRAVAATCLVVVAVIYNTIVPGTGSAPPWVSITVHAIFPLVALADWTLVADRPILPWSRLWIVLPYPLAWLAVVLVRGATDGWVPYGFLLPERGVLSLAGASAGLLLALLAAGAVVWALPRVRGRPGRRPSP